MLIPVSIIRHDPRLVPVRQRHSALVILSAYH